MTDDGTRHIVERQRHPRRSYGRKFMTLFLDNDQICEQIDSAVTWKLLHHLPKHLNFTEFRRLDQRTMAAKLKVTDGAISRSLRQIHELGLVERQGKGPVTMWRLSPDYGWQGTVEQYHAYREKRAQKENHKPPPNAQKSQKIYYGTSAARS